MTQAMWKERNRFVHPLFPNGLGFNEYNILKTNILTELSLGKIDKRKGNRNLIKES